MISGSRWCVLPSVLLVPADSLSKFVERYRSVPNGLAFVLAAVVSFMLAGVAGIFGGFAAMYLYDRGMSRGNDFAVSLGGLFSAGTFTFVVVFTWLQKVHHRVSSRTSLFAFYTCLALPVLATVMSADEMDYYLMFVLGDWLAILVLGSLSLLVCRRWWEHQEQGF